MAVAHSIFTLGGWVQLFWTAFDMPVARGTIKSCIRIQKNVFWEIKKNNHDVTLRLHLPDYFFETPKNKISAILMQLLMVPL